VFLGADVHRSVVGGGGGEDPSQVVHCDSLR
jgi:hypothetical protein